MLRSLLAAFALALLVAPAAIAQPQLTLPQASPAASVSQTVGLTTIDIHYHRPQARGRTVWGALVPWNVLWRLGANENTTIAFSDDVTIDGQPLEAGTYGLHAIPREDRWTFVFSHNADLWGSFNYDESEDALRVDAVPRRGPEREAMLLFVPEVRGGEADVVMQWAGVEVGFTVGVDLQTTVAASMQRELRALHGFFPQNWGAAARWMLANDGDVAQATEWIDRGIAQQPTLPNIAVKADLMERDGQTEEAQVLVAEALPRATEAEVNAYGYALLQTGRTARAIEIFAYNVRRHPESWNVHDSLGEAMAAAGRTAEAIEHYEHAHELAPTTQKQRIEGILAQLRD